MGVWLRAQIGVLKLYLHPTEPQPILLKDGMMRAPFVRFGTSARAAHLKFFLEDPINSDTMSIVVNKL